MANIKTLFGCAGIRGPLESYARRFDVLELDFLARGKPVREATLRKWRKEAGPSLQFSLLAPRSVATLRASPEYEEDLRRLLESQRVLQALFMVIVTPTDVTPAPLQRERLERLIQRIRDGLGDARDIVQIAWEPHGVWEADSAAQFAKQLGVDLSVDPLADPREPFWDASLRYLRLSAIGGRTVYSPTRLRTMAELLVATQGVVDSQRNRVVVFTTPNAPNEAKRLKSLVAQLEAKPKRSASRPMVIGPRTPGISAISSLHDAGEE